MDLFLSDIWFELVVLVCTFIILFGVLSWTSQSLPARSRVGASGAHIGPAAAPGVLATGAVEVGKAGTVAEVLGGITEVQANLTPSPRMTKTYTADDLRSSKADHEPLSVEKENRALNVERPDRRDEKKTVPQVQEKCVAGVPTQEIVRHVPKAGSLELVREVRRVGIQYQDTIVEVPRVQTVERVVHVPVVQEGIPVVAKVEYVDKVIVRRLEVPKVEIQTVEELRQIPMLQIVDVPVGRPFPVRRAVPVPFEETVERFVDVPKPVLRFLDVPRVVPVPVQVPEPPPVVRVEVEQIRRIPVRRYVARRVPVPMPFGRARLVQLVVQPVVQLQVVYLGEVVEQGEAVRLPPRVVVYGLHRRVPF